jgi:tetratricopeptide (TPR) repeat protein
MTRTSSLVAVLCVLGASRLAAQQIPVPFPLKVLEESVARDSNDASVHYLVALAYWNEKRYDEAERSLRLSMMLDPKFAEPHLALAYLPYARRPKLWRDEQRNRIPEEWKARMEESDREYRRAFFINPFVDLRIIGAVTPHDEGRWRFDYPELYEFIQKPYDDIFAGQYVEAYHGFEQLERRWGLAARGPLPRNVYWFKALSAARIGKLDQAIGAIDRLLKEQERNEEENNEKIVFAELRTNEYRYIKAILLQAQGRKDDAIALFRTVLEKDIGVYMAHVRMAALYEENKQWPEAVAERQNAVNANPDDPSLLVDLGVTAGLGNDLDLAIDALGRAGEANPRLADAAYWTGMVQLVRGNREEAKRSLTRFLALAPSRSQGKIEAATKRLEELQ